MGRVTPGQHRLPIRLVTVEARGRRDRPALPPLPTTPVRMRTPCHTCGSPDGRVTRKASQAVVRCASCDAYAYCAPRLEQLQWWGQVR